jgi:hypothetical protein
MSATPLDPATLEKKVFLFARLRAFAYVLMVAGIAGLMWAQRERVATVVYVIIGAALVATVGLIEYFGHLKGKYLKQLLDQR